MSDLREIAEEFASLSSEAGVEGAITGGFALILRDSYRLTQDIDFDVNVEGGAVEELITTLKEDDRYEFVTKGMEPASPPNIENVKEGSIFSVKRSVDGEAYKIDVIPHQADFMDIVKTEKVRGLPVVAREVIVAEKLWLISMGEARGTDWEDIVRIIGVCEVDEEYLREILNLLEVDYELYGAIRNDVK